MIKIWENFINRAMYARLNTRFFLVYILVFFFLPFMYMILSSVFSSPAHATIHTASITTSGSLSIDAMPTGDGVSIDSDNINITSTCRAGYNLSIYTSTSDNNLYLNGDTSNNTTGTYYTPSNGTTSLYNSNNSWGYLLSQSSPTGSSTFLAVPGLGNSAVLKTFEETASEADIDDSFPVYYGTKTTDSILPGTYKMTKDNSNSDGAIVYVLLMNPTCTETLEVSFNKNMDGEGGESDPGSTVTNFPTSSDNVEDLSNNALTLSNKIPVRTGYVFKEWNTETDGTGDYFYPSETINIGSGEHELNGEVTLYAIWVEECADTKICYDSNHADSGTMPIQDATANANNLLISSNYARADYGFTGWNTKADGTGTQYGPNGTIRMPASGGVNLFATWIKPTGILQTWAGASNMNIGDVIALRDNRDDEVYTVAKLADNNVWITENLRLVLASAGYAGHAGAHITEHNTNGPTQSFLDDYASVSPTSSMCAANTEDCINSIVYNANNLDRSLNQEYNVNSGSSAWYSYGVMYNWYVATAGNGTKSDTGNVTGGDLCPAGWRIPTGGASGEWGVATTAINNYITSHGGSVSGDSGLRAYPNNFLRSGDFNTNSGTGRGYQGRFWTTTAKDNNNTYRIGYNSEGITATANAYNKWAGFSVRCIYQGGNIPYSDLNINFAGTGITSLTFTNPNYSTETATPSNPVVNLAENVTYTVTATTTTGYEVTSWATTSGGTLGDSTTTNPAPSTNTYAISEEATLTVTGQVVPTYQVSLTLGEHVSSVSFYNVTYGTETITPASASCTDNGDDTYTCTVTLRRGVNYALSSSYESGYSIDHWSAGNNSTIGSTTISITTYSITGNTTLSVTAKEADELTYHLIYGAGSGTSAPVADTIDVYTDTHTFTITDSAPIYYGYNFLGWSETEGSGGNGTTVNYTSGNTITVISTGLETSKHLYPVYEPVASCPAGKICYYDNGADVLNGGRGTMANQSSNLGRLIPSNYSRTGSGFAGWVTSENATPYGPNADIDSSLATDGLKLYAKWVDSVGDMQTWNGCSSLAQGGVTALTDTRDNNTYAVAKLADNNCWVIENLRLDPGLSTINTSNTHSPTSTFISESDTTSGGTLPSSSLSTNTMCNDTTSACYDQIQYNSNSSDRSLTQSYKNNDATSAWYSYGTYYNWYTATAGNGTYDTINTSGPNNNGTVGGDICPKKWRLPTGNTNGEFNALNTAVNSGLTNSDAGLRAYPVNLLWSGDYNNTNRKSSYSNGRIWTATAKNNLQTYRLGFASSTVTAASGAYDKWDGFAIRCIYDQNAVEYSDLTVTLPQGASSVTFESSGHDTETATAQNPTVSLIEGVIYTMTANMPGYELTSWTAGQNATIGNQNQNPTTISITDNTTLTLTITEIPTYQITVNLDANSSSISFTSADYPTQTVTNVNAGTGSDTDTVSLRRGAAYTITASFTSGYELDSWTAGTDSTVGSTTANPTTYTVTNTSTLTVTSQQSSSSPGSFDAAYQSAGKTKLNSHYKMQDMSASICTAIDEGETTTLIDSRDNKEYYVAKLADSNCWMTQNLDHDIDSSFNYNSTNTDVPSNWSDILTSTYATSITTWDYSDTTPESYDPGNLCWNGTINNSWSGTPDTATATCGNDKHYHIGNYYNWTAAVAMADSDSYTTEQDVNQSICPAGWRLPTYSGNKSYDNLISTLSLTSDANGNIHNSPVYFVYGGFGGYWNGGEPSGIGSGGYYWLSVASDISNAHDLFFNAEGYLIPQHSIGRGDSVSVRCVAR